MANKSLSAAINMLKDLKKIGSHTDTSTNTKQLIVPIPNNNILERIILIDTESIRDWELKDRLQNKLRDIDTLVHQFSEIRDQCLL